MKTPGQICVEFNSEFGYEIEQLEFRIPLVDQGRFIEDISDALKYLAGIGDSASPRLQAALAYFYRAERLLESGHTPWEFAAEAVLNFSKCLEVLFPPEGDGKTRDAVRNGLSVNGVSKDDAETWFLPALALRSELDVAHVKLAVLDKAHIETLARYTQGASPHFRNLLKHLLDGMVGGRTPIADHLRAPLQGAALDVLEALKRRIELGRPPNPA